MKKHNKIWEDLLSEHDRRCLSNTSEFAPRRGLGNKPAILVIDMQKAVIGEDRPIYEQQNIYPYACGNFAWKSIKHIKPLLEFARKKNITVAYTKHCYRPEYGYSGRPKNDVFAYDNPNSKIISEISPLIPGDIVIEKQGASAFFSTSLPHSLRSRGIDTVLIVGNTTSGCVRATAIDASGYSFKTAIIEECVFDRLEMAHKSSLFDLQYKYCDVISIEETYEYIENLK